MGGNGSKQPHLRGALSQVVFHSVCSNSESCEWTEMSPAERTCLQGASPLPMLAFSRQPSMCLNFFWCLLPSSPERTDISKSLVRPLKFLITLSCPYQASQGTTTYTCPWALWLLFKSDWGIQSFSSAVTAHTAWSVFCCSSLLPGPSACTMELHCR